MITWKLAEMVKPEMLWDKERGRYVLGYYPKNLLSALWLQLGQEVAGNKSFRRCPTCSKWFENSSDGARADRMFCSSACRNTAFRERQDKARQLHVLGKSFQDIAKEVGSDEATVKKWITGIKERPSAPQTTVGPGFPEP
jgi:transposase-like protein